MGSITVRMDFERYCGADPAQRIRQIEAMILTAVEKVKKKGRLDFDAFKADLQSMP